MKRVEQLVPFSHDHQHGLAQALRLRRAAESGDAAALATHVDAALAFAAGELAEHMEREEVGLLPALARLDALEPDEVDRVARDHLRVRSLAAQLADDRTDARTALELATLLHDHIRWEERELFERAQERLAGADAAAVERLLGAVGDGQLAIAEPQRVPGASGLASGALNATNVRLAPGDSLAAAQLERDVALVVLDGRGELLLAPAGGDPSQRVELEPGRTIVMPSGSTRTIAAGPSGLAFTTVHVRREGLSVRRAPSA